MNPNRQAAGRLGGLTTSARHGHEHYLKLGEWGVTGGRPRLSTASIVPNQIERNGHQGGLRELTKWFKSNYA